MNYYNAIVIIESQAGKSAAKYRTINNCDRFLSFVKKYWVPKGATAVNFYHKKSKVFSHQVKL